MCTSGRLGQKQFDKFSGYSPCQLVYGRLPNLPNVLRDKVPALEGITSSVVFQRHLGTLHQARRSYLEAESSERIRKALRHKLRAYNCHLEVGCRVYYQPRTKHWRGPAKNNWPGGKYVCDQTRWFHNKGAQSTYPYML